ncbi:hypothetical protein LCGC14_2664680, partial [marine sediment metagenome]
MPQPKRRNISQTSEMVYDIHSFGIMIDTREIFLGAYINSNGEFCIDHKSSNIFIKNIQLLNNLSNKQILVHMNTIGGDWNYGMAIYD